MVDKQGILSWFYWHPYTYGIPRLRSSPKRRSSTLDGPFKGELITPNAKLKLLQRVREVMGLKHYSIRTERTYCDWIRRYVQFQKMQNREELQKGKARIELFLSDLAVNGQVAASTQNQAFDARNSLNIQRPTQNIQH